MLKNAFSDSSVVIHNFTVMNTARADKKIQTVAVFCGSSRGDDPKYAEHARQIGLYLGAQGYNVMYGAGDRGLMGVVSKAALDAGGRVYGLTMQHFNEESQYFHQNFGYSYADSVQDRKRLILNASDASIVLPGGIGTLDEYFEAATDEYLAAYLPDQRPQKPIWVMNTNGLYTPLIQLQQNLIGAGFAHSRAMELSEFFEEPELLINAMEAAESAELNYLPHIGNVEQGLTKQ